ncbi:MAG TPA: hypothetical protein PLJ71_22010 [Candidatus Hydrogenedentes bacterium]|nr:hypothetical protein [Candidatus Hydrogenedentota bacterium]HQM51364.1 hypothetical protein [Candidatus Hydrogenedentota bacterium]
MLNLYWKTSKGKTANLVDTPFQSEADFEKYVYENQELLEDIFIFKRQIRSGSHDGIPDMLGVDQDGKVCLIELKNAQVTEDVLPQVLQYAIWGETNPDSIRALWLEVPDRPEDITINWEALEIRVIVIGPSFRSNVLRMSYKIGYDLELLEVRRFVYEGEEFIIVEELEEETQPRNVVTRALQHYDRAFYEREHGKQATAELFGMVKQIEEIVKRKGWQLQQKINKYYVGFKYGNKNPISVHWGGTHAWRVAIKIPEKTAKTFKAKNWEFQRYDKSFNQAILKPVSKHASARELEALLIQAFENVQGDV